MARFDSVFGLPAAKVDVDNSLARAATPWLSGGEETQDTEIVHAIAPAATIREVLVNEDALATPASAITAFTAAFHDITTGDNTVEDPPVTITGYQAGRGWDPVTGLGSPNAQVLVPLLAR